MKKVFLYSDGACSVNPGPGGWGSILTYQDSSKELSQGYKNTTNNRMELMGIIEPLRLLKEPCEVIIYSDSKYVVNAINKKWLDKWATRNWKRSDGYNVANIDLWKILLKLQDVHQLSFNWIKGHNGHIENERCDKLAVLARKQINLLEDNGYSR